MRHAALGVLVLIAVATGGCMRHFLDLGTRPMYRLVDCTSSGASQLTKALTGRASGYGTSNSGSDPTKFYVPQGDWQLSIQALHVLEKVHPKDFSNEATRPIERMPDLP